MIGFGIHRDLIFFHNLQQACLRFGGGAVDFIRKDEIAHHRARPEFELAGFLVKNRETGDVRREDIRCELNPLERAGNRPRKRPGKACLADTGNIFYQHVAATGEGNHDKLHGLPFADDHFFNVVNDPQKGFSTFFHS